MIFLGPRWMWGKAELASLSLKTQSGEKEKERAVEQEGRSWHDPWVFPVAFPSITAPAPWASRPMAAPRDLHLASANFGHSSSPDDLTTASLDNSDPAASSQVLKEPPSSSWPNRKSVASQQDTAFAFHFPISATAAVSSGFSPYTSPLCCSTDPDKASSRCLFMTSVLNGIYHILHCFPEHIFVKKFYLIPWNATTFMHLLWWLAEYHLH